MKSRYRNLGIVLTGIGILAGLAVVNRESALRTERLAPPKGQFIEIDGVRVHYLEAGQGRPVVLLHGNGATAEDFAQSGLMELLSRRHRVLVFDRPGFGYSARPRGTAWTPAAQAELLHKALETLGVKHPIVVGHSFGTLVALAMALDHPGDLAGLVLVSGYYFPTLRLDMALYSPASLPFLRSLLAHTILPLVRWLIGPPLLQKIFAPAPIPAKLAGESPLDMSFRPSQLRATAEDTAFMNPAAATLAKRYAGLTLPIHILAGDSDRIVRTEHHSAKLHTLIPRSRLHILNGAGHMPHHTNADSILDAVGAIRTPNMVLAAE